MLNPSLASGSVGVIATKPQSTIDATVESLEKTIYELRDLVNALGIQLNPVCCPMGPTASMGESDNRLPVSPLATRLQDMRSNVENIYSNVQALVNSVEL